MLPPGTSGIPKWTGSLLPIWNRTVTNSLAEPLMVMNIVGVELGVGVGVGVGSMIDTWRQVVVGTLDSVTPATENDVPYNAMYKDDARSNGLRSVPDRSAHASSL
jgi:hypothetical protein